MTSKYSPDFNQTALIFAAQSPLRGDVCKLLIDHAADLDAQDGAGKTALHYAIANNSTDIAKMLCNAGADPYIPDNQGQTAVALAKTKNSSYFPWLFDAPAKKPVVVLPLKGWTDHGI